VHKAASVAELSGHCDPEHGRDSRHVRSGLWRKLSPQETAQAPIPIGVPGIG
jgi:hypothetical protein